MTEPPGLREAVLAYERALMADDVAVLDDFFEPGPDTLRGDASGLLQGHDAIAAFRRARGGTPTRTIRSIEIRELGENAAVVVLVVDPATGGHGLLTQLWRRTRVEPVETRPRGAVSTGSTRGVWRIAVAQVAAPAPAIDGRIWRIVGTPLVAGAASGPLAGKTVAVKDLFEVAGFAVGAGNPRFLAEASPAPTTAPAIQALLDAGASVRGIAQTDEFAYAMAGVNGHYGTPPNGAVPGAIPGGSSSGPASAVALGQADIGLGTDTGGSIRVPASYQGLWGLRTTHDAVSRSGLLPLAATFDTVGWLTRDAATLRAAAVATLGEATEPVGDFVLSSRLLSVVDPEVRAAFLERVRPLGAVEDVDVGDLDPMFETFRVVQAAEAWEADGEWLSAHPGATEGGVAERFALASQITPEQAGAARDALARHRERLDTLLGERLLLLPSASSAAPRIGDDLSPPRAATLRLTGIAGITGRPALGVPLLQVSAGPVGLCLVGPRGSDLALIDLASDKFP